jgi:galacturonokinase
MNNRGQHVELHRTVISRTVLTFFLPIAYDGIRANRVVKKESRGKMGDHSIIDPLRAEVVKRYGVPSGQVVVVRAPYRICPLGAHIDHQLGPVTAMALDRAVYVAFAPSRSPELVLSSLDFPGETRFSLNHVPDPRPGDWGNYARGAVRALQSQYGLHTGICGVTAGRLDGGGLSSSAAIGVALLLALEHANGLQVSPEENIRLDQAIENGYLGLRNGILDQAAILLSRRGQLTYVDCLTGDYQRFSPPADPFRFTILIAFSGLKQALVATDYNRRVEQCTAAAKALLAAVGRPDAQPVLRSISLAEYRESKQVLKGAEARRAEHFFSEMQRVELGVAAWREGDLERFGQLIRQSGASSIENYQCGCPPLIDLYGILHDTPGVLGARFSGAGFRGCCVALTQPEAGEQAAERVLAEYRRRHPELADDAYTLLCQTSDGATVLDGPGKRGDAWKK